MRAKGNCELSLRLGFPSAKEAKAVMQSVFPLGGKKRVHERRSSTEVSVKKNSLLMRVRAKDKVALKASLNSHLKLIGVAMEILEE